MTAFVVDTNVAIVANRRGTHGDQRCQLACVEKLETVVAQDVVAIDDGHAILAEYGRLLRASGCRARATCSTNMYLTSSIGRIGYGWSQ